MCAIIGRGTRRRTLAPRVEPENEVHDPLVFLPAHLDEAVRDYDLMDATLCSAT